MFSWITNVYLGQIILGDLQYGLQELISLAQRYNEQHDELFRRDEKVRRFVETNGSLEPLRNESAYYDRIRKSFEKAMWIQERKVDISLTQYSMVR